MLPSGGGSSESSLPPWLSRQVSLPAVLNEEQETNSRGYHTALSDNFMRSSRAGGKTFEKVEYQSELPGASNFNITFELILLTSLLAAVFGIRFSDPSILNDQVWVVWFIDALGVTCFTVLIILIFPPLQQLLFIIISKRAKVIHE